MYPELLRHCTVSVRRRPTPQGCSRRQFPRAHRCAQTRYLSAVKEEKEKVPGVDPRQQLDKRQVLGRERQGKMHAWPSPYRCRSWRCGRPTLPSPPAARPGIPGRRLLAAAKCRRHRFRMCHQRCSLEAAQFSCCRTEFCISHHNQSNMHRCLVSAQQAQRNTKRHQT